MPLSLTPKNDELSNSWYFCGWRMWHLDLVPNCDSHRRHFSQSHSGLPYFKFIKSGSKIWFWLFCGRTFRELFALFIKKLKPILTTAYKFSPAKSYKQNLHLLNLILGLPPKIGLQRWSWNQYEIPTGRPEHVPSQSYSHFYSSYSLIPLGKNDRLIGLSFIIFPPPVRLNFVVKNGLSDLLVMYRVWLSASHRIAVLYEHNSQLISPGVTE